MFIVGKVDFKPKLVKRDEVFNYILINGTIHQEDIVIVHLYSPNVGELSFIKQILPDIKIDPDSDPTIVGDFNIPLSSTDRSSAKIIRNFRAILCHRSNKHNKYLWNIPSNNYGIQIHHSDFWTFAQNRSHFRL
jgi:hypothetical protein